MTDDKHSLRRQLTAIRKARHAEVADAGDALAAQAAGLALPKDAVVAGYMPAGSEIDVRPLLAVLAAAGHRIGLPVCDADDAPMQFRLWQPGDALAADAAGVSAPLPDALRVTPDVLLLPLLGFDRTGGRLGRGGGHYDRTLAALRPACTAYGAAYAAQEVDKCPVEPHDQFLDGVITETALHLFSDG